MPKDAKDWLSTIERRHRALRRKWLDAADQSVRIYEAQEEDRVPFNILYSNTETLIPALYNSTPRPEVARRFTAPDANRVLDSALSQTAERLLEYLADSNVLEYQNFDSTVKGCVLGALVPGAGIARVRYHADEEGGYQEICFENVPYDRFVWGYARKWDCVPWVAYGHDLSKEEFAKKFPRFAATKKFKEYSWPDEASEIYDEGAERRQEDGTKKEPVLLVWEIWIPASREVKFVCNQFRDDFLLEEPYPFDLTSRFPSPEPLCFIRRNFDLTPIPPYELYRKQAEELNEVTRRLHLVIKAIKVRGAYNSQMAEISQILESDDTALVPVENASVMGETGGFDKHIWLMPIQELIAVARELYVSQTNCKNTIFEIMGIADIQRGASVASETAKAQEIKNRWGTLRVKRMQTDVQLFCRQLFRIAFEFGVNLLSPATLKAITQLPYLFNEEKRQLSMALQSGQASPELQAKAILLQAPSWEDISAYLQNTFERTYRIDIETNSTVDLEATEDKAEIAEFMNAWGQMMSGFQPLITSGVMPFEVVKLVISEVFRRFRFARRVEMALETIQQPQPQENPNIVKERHAAELQKVQADAKRQIGEMQETIIELTAALERLKIENTALKNSRELAVEASNLDRKKVEVDGKLREHLLTTDYNGKMRLQQEQALKREQALKDKMMKDEIMRMIQQHTAAMEQQKAAVPDLSGLEAALQQLASSQTALMEGMDKLTRLVMAEREAEIFIGPDGKKRSRSRIVYQ